MLTTDEARYRERKAIVEAENWEGPDFKTCANAAAIARALETSLSRRSRLRLLLWGFENSPPI